MQIPDDATSVKVRVVFRLPVEGVEFVPAEATLTITAPALKKSEGAPTQQK